MAGAEDLAIVVVAVHQVDAQVRTDAMKGAQPFGAAVEEHARVAKIHRHLLAGMDLGGGALSSAGDLDGFVVKLSADGEFLWSRRFGDANPDMGIDVAADADGFVTVTGWFEGSVDLGSEPLASAGGRDAFLARLAP